MSLRPGAWASLRGAARHVPGVVAFALAAAVLLVHARAYLPFFADDGFISLRYAQRLLEGRGLTWNDGERVEGYSNLLWVLGCAGLGALGVDLVSAARWLGQASALAALAALPATFWCARLERKTVVPSLVPALALALSGSLAVWSVGGLEQPLFAALLAWGLFGVFHLLPGQVGGATRARAWTLAGLPFALLCWTRPDGILVAGLVGFGVLLAGHSRGLGGDLRHLRRPWLAATGCLMALPVAFALLQTCFRLIYYGAWIPNPGSAKLAFTVERWTSGGQYLLDALGPHKAIVALAAMSLLPLLRSPTARSRLLVLMVPAIGWSLYVVGIGGDIFPARRHLVVPLVLAAFAVGEGLIWLEGLRPRVRAWTSFAVAGCLALYCADQATDPQNVRAREERWEWDGQVIGSFLHRHFGLSGTRLATDSAGALPYFSRLTTIDMLGLNDRYLSTHRPADFGRGALGHELGDGAYVLGRQPDLVIFGLPYGERHALYRSGREMQSDPKFAAQFAFLTFEATGPRTVPTRVWVRRDSERLGVRREPGRVVVPGFSFAVGQAVAREDGEGRLGAVVSAFSPGAARVGDIALGRWRVTVEGSGPPMELSVQPRSGEAMTGGPPFVFEVSGEARDVDLAVRPRGAGMAHVRQVVLTRVENDDPMSESSR
jgi:arabinofuranosyltransferase